MGHPLTEYARAWLFGWDEVYGDPAAIRPDELTPQLLRRAWALRRQMMANAHHVMVQRLMLDDRYMVISDLRLSMQERSKATFLSSVDQIRRARTYDQKLISGLPKMRARVREARAEILKVGDAATDELFRENLDSLVDVVDRDLRQRPTRAGHARIHTTDEASVDGLRSTREDERGDLRKRLAKVKRLSGPDTQHAVDVLFAALYEESPWLREPLESMWRGAQDAVEDPDIGFWMPPTLLVGPPGCGKTHLAQRISELSGCPSTRLDMSGLSAAFEVTGTEYTWRSSTPSAVVKLIDGSGAANPIMIVDEVDKSGRTSAGDPAQALLPLLQRSTARDFRESYLQAKIDLSRVSWILLANDLQQVPAPLVDRCAVFSVSYPSGDHLRDLVARKLVDAEPEIISFAAAELESGRMSLRGIDRLAQRIRRILRAPMLN